MKEFEWDENKNRKNKEKHNLSFEDAAQVFEDENRLQYAVETKGETRYITNSLSKQDEEYDKEKD